MRNPSSSQGKCAFVKVWLCVCAFPLLSNLTVQRCVWETGRVTNTWLWELMHDYAPHTHADFLPHKLYLHVNSLGVALNSNELHPLKHWGLNGNQNDRRTIRSHVCLWLRALKLLGALDRWPMCFIATDSSLTHSPPRLRPKSCLLVLFDLKYLSVRHWNSSCTSLSLKLQRV